MTTASSFIIELLIRRNNSFFLQTLLLSCCVDARPSWFVNEKSTLWFVSRCGTVQL